VEIFISVIGSASDVRQIETLTADPLVPDPRPFQVEITIAKLKNYKSPGSDHIPTELIRAGGKVLWCDINRHGVTSHKTAVFIVTAVTTHYALSSIHPLTCLE
jgi:hypothetical protein